MPAQIQEARQTCGQLLRRHAGHEKTRQKVLIFDNAKTQKRAEISALLYFNHIYQQFTAIQVSSLYSIPF